jgi:hypothetical protein
MSFYRVVFALAAIYNTAFGLWGGLRPQAFFEWFELEPPRYPWVWACLGMVVGVYGVAYAWAAWKPEQADVLIGIGLLGKVLGPMGWLWNVAAGEIPPRTFPLILFNDLIWWFPFAFYLLRNVAARGAIIGWIAFGVHAVACAGLLIVAPGTEAEPSFAARRNWIMTHPALWSANWFVWVPASLSLGAFTAVWSGAIAAATPADRRAGAAGAAAIGAALVFAGVPFDLANEALAVVRLTHPVATFDEFKATARLCTTLGAGVANGLYCVGGLLVSLAAVRSGFQTGWKAALGFAMWTIGLGLTAAALADHRPTMIAAGGATMALFLAFSAITAVQMGRAANGRVMSAEQ